jgi:hypothetical protein
MPESEPPELIANQHARLVKLAGTGGRLDAAQVAEDLKAVHSTGLHRGDWLDYGRAIAAHIYFAGRADARFEPGVKKELSWHVHNFLSLAESRITTHRTPFNALVRLLVKLHDSHLK